MTTLPSFTPSPNPHTSLTHVENQLNILKKETEQPFKQATWIQESLTKQSDSTKKTDTTPVMQNSEKVTQLRDQIKGTLHDTLQYAHEKDNQEEVKELSKRVKAIKNVVSQMENVFSSIISSDATTAPMIDEIKTRLKQAEDELSILVHSYTIEAKARKPAFQAYKGEALDYDQYKLIKHISEKHVSGEHAKMSRAEQRLLERVKKENLGPKIQSFEDKYNAFVAKNLKNLNNLSETFTAIKAEKATPEQLKFVMDCKLWYMDVMSTEGTFLDILSFRDGLGPEFSELGVIESTAMLQSKQLNTEINKAILEMHNNNQPKEGNPIRTVIAGAGPIGLYTAMRMFVAGANITVVNDRSEWYVRNQIVDLDPKWMAQLQFFLGTQFDECFGAKAPGARDVLEGYGEINTWVLEDRMKTRCAEIMSYVNEHAQAPAATAKSSVSGAPSPAAPAQPGTPAKPQFNLSYEANIVTIYPPDNEHPNFHVHLKPPERDLDTKRLHDQCLFDGRALKIMETKYLGKDFEQRLEEGGKTVLELAFEEAKEQIAKEGSEKREEKAVEFDLLCCCGGANDRVRDEYLSPAIPLTAPKNYGVCVWVKGQQGYGKKMLVKPDDRVLSIENLKEPMERQKFDKYIQESALPPEIKAKYANFTERLFNEIQNHKNAHTSKNGVPIRAFENKETFYVGAETSLLMAELIKDIAKWDPKNEKGHKTALERKWFTGLSAALGAETENNRVMTFDPFPINTGTFDVEQRGVRVAAKQLTSPEGNAAVITVLGDARISPQFFSGSGLSTGRLGVEKAASWVQAIHQSKIGRADLARELNKDLEVVKEKAIEKGSPYMSPSPISEEKSHTLKVCDAITKECKIENKIALEKKGFTATSPKLPVTPQNPDFTIKVLIKGQEKEIEARINEKGEIEIKRPPSPLKFNTIADVYFASSEILAQA